MDENQQPGDAPDTAGVILPPPVILLVFIVLGAVLEIFVPRPFASDWAQTYLGPALVVGAVAVAIIAERQFKSAGTSVKPWVPTTAIVTTGLFSVSRNPMYAAMVVLLFGLAFAGNTLWILTATVGFVGVMHYGVILREEAYLERLFGAVYTDYKARVRRWI
ncbi:isoprenylcysteine carboxylmethyltransferase family protein [Nisaea sp.]|uniref:methyltransferase family protein n=1 Tax=Nisaea sp. TaxID=2024842 RepID=UPI003296B758